MSMDTGRRGGAALAIVSVVDLVAALVLAALGAVLSSWVLYIPAGALLLVALITGVIWRVVSQSSHRTQALLANGVDGTATITSMQQTSVYMNGQPRVDFVLDVTRPGHPAYQARIKQFVPVIYAGRLTDGRPLSVKIDPGRSHEGDDPLGLDASQGCRFGRRTPACRRIH